MLLLLAIGTPGAVAAALGVTWGCLVLTSHFVLTQTPPLAGMDRFARTGQVDGDLGLYIPFMTTVGLGLFAMALTFLTVASLIYRRPLRSFLTSAPRFRWSLVAWGAVINFALLGIVLAADVLSGHSEVEPPLLTPGATLSMRLTYALSCVGVFYLAALAEEMIFRGWLMQQLGAFTHRIVLILAVNAVLFSLIHLDPNIDAFLSRIAMGLAMGWIVLRTGGLEFAVGAHMANNLLITLFIEPLTAADVERHPFDIGSLAVELVSATLLVLAVELFLRRSRRGQLVLQSA